MEDITGSKCPTSASLIDSGEFLVDWINVVECSDKISESELRERAFGVLSLLSLLRLDGDWLDSSDFFVFWESNEVGDSTSGVRDRGVNNFSESVSDRGASWSTDNNFWFGWLLLSKDPLDGVGDLFLNFSEIWTGLSDVDFCGSGDIIRGGDRSI